MYKVSSINKLCDDREGGGSREDDEDEHMPKPVPSFTEAHAASEIVKSFIYAYNDEHDQEHFERGKDAVWSEM